ncbi:MAG: hypothetical protein ABFD69_02170 [Candidatus Sumerlaeia bacterium]
MPGQEDQKELVRQILYDAFPDLPCDDSSRITHEDCLEIRGLLHGIKDEDIAFVLKNVLIDLLDTHTIEEPHNVSADFVTQYLDVEGLIKESYLGLSDDDLDMLVTEFQQRGFDAEAIKRKLTYIRNIDRKHVSDAEKRECMERIQLFSTFTPKQACAIYKWLELALEWEDLFYRKDEIESAMRYWGERCKPTDGRREG